jgi:hypothetical protein
MLSVTLASTASVLELKSQLCTKLPDIFTWQIKLLMPDGRRLEPDLQSIGDFGVVSDMMLHILIDDVEPGAVLAHCSDVRTANGGAKELSRPSGLALDAEHQHLYVLNRGNPTATACKLDISNWQRCLVLPMLWECNIGSLGSCCLTADKLALMVLGADTTSISFLSAADGQVMSRCSIEKAGLRALWGVAIDPSNHNVWISGCSSRSVQVFQPLSTIDGHFALIPFDGRKLTDSLKLPVGVVFGDGKVFVSDYERRSVSVYDPETDAMLHHIVHEKMRGAHGMCIDTDRHRLYVCDINTPAVHVFDSLTNEYVGNVTGIPAPLCVAVDVANRKVFCSCYTDNELLVFQAF